LIDMVQLLKGEDGRANPNVHVILIGPPQVDADAWARQCQIKHKLSAPPVTRLLSHTRLYADAAREVSLELESAGHTLPYVNCWSFTSDLVNMFRDGLHFSPKGNHKLFKVVRFVLGERWPHLAAEKRPLDSFPFLQIKTKELAEVQDMFDKHRQKQLRSQEEQSKQQAAAAAAVSQ
jgi:hypothetical protein